MPTALPSRPTPEQRISWPTAARVWLLIMRVHLLDQRLHALVERGAGFSDDRLLRLARRWLALHERIGVLLPGLPEPEHVRQVRAILQGRQYWERARHESTPA